MYCYNISLEDKLEAVKACLEGKTNPFNAGKKLGVSRSLVYYWVARYKEEGVEGLKDSRTRKDREYSPELKKQVVEDFLNNHESVKDLEKKYNVRSATTINYWIKEYNRYGYFHQGSGGVNVTNAKKISINERLEIVLACIEDPSKCGEFARKYMITYQMVRYWVTKYKKYGIDGLQDRRGKRIAQQEPRDEVEALKTKLAKLEHENYLLTVERDLLKKVKQLERGNL